MAYESSGGFVSSGRSMYSWLRGEVSASWSVEKN